MSPKTLAIIQGLGILISSTAAYSQLSVINDRGLFVAQFPSHAREGFESFAPGTNAPLVTESLVLEGLDEPAAPEILDNLVALPHSYWFQGLSSPENFVLANTDGLAFSWLSPVVSAGLDIQCFFCDNPGSPSLVRFEAFGADGSALGTADLSVELDGTPRFVGIRSTSAISRLQIRRLMNGGGFGNYLVDDIRSVSDQIFPSGFD